MLAAGIALEDVDAQVAAEAAAHPPFEVYADNWPTLEVFRALWTQWKRSDGMAGGAILGIDYGGVALPLACVRVERPDGTLRRLTRDERDDVFAGLRIMEAAALPILNKPAETTDG